MNVDWTLYHVCYVHFTYHAIGIQDMCGRLLVRERRIAVQLLEGGSLFVDA